MKSSKPSVTVTRNVLNFRALDPETFERLCLWLAEAEGFQQIQHLGASGSEQGRDILAWNQGELFAFQCKRVMKFGPADAKAEIKKLLKLPVGERPQHVVFVVTSRVSVRTRREAKKLWGTWATPENCEFWSETELDERVKRHPRILEEFFGNQALTTKHLADSFPTPPSIYALPPYVSSHQFVGRRSQLQALKRWAESDTSPVLVIDAIGGTGKSQLTWEWLTRHAENASTDWAGRYWYSFYEKGATLDDFCLHAVAYITNTKATELRDLTFSVLRQSLIQELRLKPWLFVLDGLERVLVGYHRFDAALVSDDEASALSDQITSRDPIVAIREEDDDLLELLVGASPSKFVITTRLLPKVLLNPAGNTIPGVTRIELEGLRVRDAERLLRSCGVTGTSRRIQFYLTNHCGCHPLVIGAMAGLIRKYRPDRGNFDAWEDDSAHGGQLDFAKLDLKRKRNHILRAALDSLTDEAKDLLSTLALIYGAVDWNTLSAFNPHDQHQSDEPASGVSELDETVSELESSGLLQYDAIGRVYNLHPVVRHVAVTRLKSEDKENLGQKVADHFSQISHDPFEDAKSLEDVLDALRVVRAFLISGQFKRAYDFFYGDLANAIYYNMKAGAETLALIRPVFPNGWASPPIGLRDTNASNLSNLAGLALEELGQLNEAKAAFGAAVQAGVQERNWNHTSIYICNLANILSLSNEVRLVTLADEMASILESRDHRFIVRFRKFKLSARMGQTSEADDIWHSLGSPPVDRAHYRPGSAEYAYALYRYWQGDLSAELIEKAKQQARHRSDLFMVQILKLEGGWHLMQQEWPEAAACLSEATRAAQNAGVRPDPVLQARLVTAQFHLGSLEEPKVEFLRLSKGASPSHRYLAELWQSICDQERAEFHALAAYDEFWGEGEPFVFRYGLKKAASILQKLGIDVPMKEEFDFSREERLPWEDDVYEEVLGAKRRSAAEQKNRKERIRDTDYDK